MRILITGGAGFIGCNAAKHFLDKGHDVIVVDNLSRTGTKENLRWLEDQEIPFTFIHADIRNMNRLKEVFQNDPIDAVLHLAAQTAVTVSVTNPRADFEANAWGTFNLLEAIRLSKSNPIVIYASTNKVYGRMDDVEVVECNDQYTYKELERGVPETRSLDFHSPYGCSKGCADQYMIDYGRIYELRTVVFRQSCIYGCRQFGIEDQGWVAWFTIAAVLGKPITIYGDGKQVRDILFIEDLIDLYSLAIKHIDIVQGQAYNVGGGFENSISLLTLISMLEALVGRKISMKFDNWRPGDQKVFISDITKVKRDLGWVPNTFPDEGIQSLFEWVGTHKALFDNIYS